MLDIQASDRKFLDGFPGDAVENRCRCFWSINSFPEGSFLNIELTAQL